MSNAVDPARPRRPRTALGQNPPQIALDLARVAACCAWTAALLDCCGAITADRVAKAVQPALTTRLMRPLEEALLPALGGFVREHLNAHAVTASGGGEQLWTWMTDDMVREGLARAFDAAAEQGSLDETIVAVVDTGMDGELLTWEVINRESVRHEGLINRECNRLAAIVPNRSPDDLKGYGWAGLRMALRGYEPSRGFAFSSYACPKINGAIRDGARAESHIPKRLTTWVRKVSQAEEKLTQQLGRTPSYAEIAQFLDESIEAMSLLPRLSPSASIEEMSQGWDDKTREPSCLIDTSVPEDEVVIRLRDAALHDAVSQLPAEEAEAVRLLMLQEVPVGEAAAMLGVEPRQLRMRKQRGMRALEQYMRQWMVENVPA